MPGCVTNRHVVTHPYREILGMLYWAFVEITEDADLARMISGSPPGEARVAEEELYRRLAPRVRLYGLRHLRDEQGAADLTQHVLLLTIEKLRQGKLREPEKLASFVLGTCRMVVRDWRRGDVRQQRLVEQYVREQPAFEEFITE